MKKFLFIAVGLTFIVGHLYARSTKASTEKCEEIENNMISALSDYKDAVRSYKRHAALGAGIARGTSGPTFNDALTGRQPVDKTAQTMQQFTGGDTAAMEGAKNLWERYNRMHESMCE